MFNEALETFKGYGIDILKSQVLGIQFTKHEFAILLTLLIDGEVLSDGEIKKKIGLSKYSCYTIIKVRIHRIRNKFVDIDPFETVQGKGYRISKAFVEYLKKTKGDKKST